MQNSLPAVLSHSSPAALFDLIQVACRPNFFSMHKLPAALPTGRSNTGRSRSDCRGQRRVSDLKDQIAKRRGDRRPAYESTGRQGGSLIVYVAYDRASPGKNPLPEENSLFPRLSESGALNLHYAPSLSGYESVFAFLSFFPPLTRSELGPGRQRREEYGKGGACPPAALTGGNALWENAGSEA